MRAISNFQITPTIDFYNNQLYENLNDEIARISNEANLLNQDLDALDNGTISEAEERIILIHSPVPIVRDYTSGQYDEEKSEAVLYLPTQFFKWPDKLNKMILIGPGVLFYLLLSKITPQRTKMIDALLRPLQYQNVQYEIRNNDIEIDGKKVMGCFAYDANGYTYEGGMITLEYDDDMFNEALPHIFYRRTYCNSLGITGIKNKYPLFNINQFFTDMLNEFGVING